MFLWQSSTQPVDSQGEAASSNLVLHSMNFTFKPQRKDNADPAVHADVNFLLCVYEAEKVEKSNLRLDLISVFFLTSVTVIECVIWNFMRAVVASQSNE